MTLTHDQRRGLQAALIAAFSTEAKLKQFVKLAFNLIPGILSYEVELGTESPLRNVFQPIKRLVEEARTKK